MRNFSAHFSSWCRQYYKEHHPHMDVNAITDVPGQLTKGDIEIVQGFGEPNIYYDEKANSKPSEGLLVELLQSAEPFGAVPQSLGWFYNLTECNYILMGYYMGKDSSALLSAYKVDLKHLRRWFYNLKELLENKSVTVTSHIAPGGFGITLFIVIPYDLLVDVGIAECLTENSLWNLR